MVADAIDPEVHVRIIQSVTPHTVDGYPQGAPKYLSCPHCAAYAFIDADPESLGWWDFEHECECPYAAD